jgi:hypothetical protein
MTFIYKLVLADGTPADRPRSTPPYRRGAVGDTIPLGRDNTLRVIETRPGTEQDDPVLVVEVR